MSTTKQLHKEMITRILEGKAQAPKAQRQAAYENTGLPKPLSIAIDKVARFSYKVTTDDITAVKASGVTEDEIFESIICAAVGQSQRQYEAAMTALDKAITENRKK
jgi:hypothetical protein